jgi:hypothetical protein
MKKEIIIFKPKYNLTIGWLILSLIMLIVFIGIRTKLIEDAQEDILETFLIIGIWTLFIGIPFLLACINLQKIEINGSIIRISYLFGIYKEEINMLDVIKITNKARNLYIKDLRLFMGIKHVKHIIIEKNNQETVKIDGNVLQDYEFDRLKKELLKFTKDKK